MTSDEEVAAASARYQAAEAEYLWLLRSRSKHDVLGAAARQVRNAAERWDDSDNRRAFARSDAHEEPVGCSADYYDLPEVLHTLWADVAAAYDGRTAAG